MKGFQNRLSLPRMRRSCVLATSLIITAISASRTNADIVYRRNDQPPMVGKVVREDKLEIVFREQFLSGATNERKIFRADILKLVKTIDDARLQSLSPDQPNDYFEYAEELAGFEQDFVARRLSMRLYLIAAYHSSKELQKSSFLGLLSFGLDQSVENRIRALAILNLDREYRSPFSLVQGIQASMELGNHEKLLEAVKLLRRGELAAAGKLLKLPEVRLACSEYGQIADWNELIAYSLLQELRFEQLLVVIRLEAQLTVPPDRASSVPTNSGWEQQSDRKMQTNQKWVRFDNILPFDPAESIYRNGKWQKPDK